MSGNLGINTDSIARAGYTAPVKDVLIYRYPSMKLPIDVKPGYYPIKLEDEYKLVMAKDGTIKKGKVVKYEEQSWMDKLKGEKPKELAKVKKEQVEAFLEKINVFGLGLKVEDIMSGNGTLNPNFKIDEKGNIKKDSVECPICHKSGKKQKLITIRYLFCINPVKLFIWFTPLLFTIYVISFLFKICFLYIFAIF